MIVLYFGVIPVPCFIGRAFLLHDLHALHAFVVTFCPELHQAAGCHEQRTWMQYDTAGFFNPIEATNWL